MEEERKDNAESAGDSGDIVRISSRTEYSEGISSSEGRQAAVLLVAGAVILMAVIGTLSYVYTGTGATIPVVLAGIIIGNTAIDMAEQALRHDIHIPGPHVRTDRLVISRDVNMLDEGGMRISRTAEYSWQDESGERRREERTMAKAFIPWEDIVSVGYGGGLALIRYMRYNIVDPDRGRTEKVSFSIPGENPEKAFGILLAEIASRNSGIRNAEREEAKKTHYREERVIIEEKAREAVATASRGQDRQDTEKEIQK